MRIVLDAMGSDDHPEPELAAAAEAHRLWDEKLTLTGPIEVLEPRIDPLAIEIIDAPEVLAMDEKPAVAAKKKLNSSMAVGMRMLKHGKADAFIRKTLSLISLLSTVLMIICPKARNLGRWMFGIEMLG